MKSQFYGEKENQMEIGFEEQEQRHHSKTIMENNLELNYEIQINTKNNNVINKLENEIEVLEQEQETEQQRPKTSMDCISEPKPHENQKIIKNKSVKIKKKKKKEIRNNNKIKASQDNHLKELSKRQKLIKRKEIKNQFKKIINISQKAKNFP